MTHAAVQNVHCIAWRVRGCVGAWRAHARRGCSMSTGHWVAGGAARVAACVQAATRRCSLLLCRRVSKIAPISPFDEAPCKPLSTVIKRHRDDDALYAVRRGCSRPPFFFFLLISLFGVSRYWPPDKIYIYLLHNFSIIPEQAPLQQPPQLTQVGQNAPGNPVFLPEPVAHNGPAQRQKLPPLSQLH